MCVRFSSIEELPETALRFLEAKLLDEVTNESAIGDFFLHAYLTI